MPEELLQNMHTLIRLQSLWRGYFARKKMKLYGASSILVNFHFMRFRKLILPTICNKHISQVKSLLKLWIHYHKLTLTTIMRNYSHIPTQQVGNSKDSGPENIEMV